MLPCYLVGKAYNLLVNTFRFIYSYCSKEFKRGKKADMKVSPNKNIYHSEYFSETCLLVHLYSQGTFSTPSLLSCDAF